MAKFIKLKIEETYAIPDHWELVKNDDGITKIKIGENEYYDFGTIPYCSASLGAEEEMMLTPEEFLDLQNKGLEIVVANGDIATIDDENEIKEILEMDEE